MRKRLECIIYGRVQGVTYRDFAFRRACKLGLVGFVQNEPDDAVSVVAEGEEEKLRELARYLWKGPFFSKVENVEEKWNEATGEFSDFHIVYS